MGNKNLTINGKEYSFLSRNFTTNSKNEKIQVEVYEYVAKGDVKHAYLMCKVPENYDFVDVQSLSDDCLKRMLESNEEVRITESDLRK